MATVEKSYDLESFRKATKSASGRIGYILSGILMLVCGCGPSAVDMCAEARKKFLDGKNMESFHDYSNVIDKYPNHSDAYNGQGNCHVIKGSLVDIQKAVISYTKAIELDQNNDQPYMNRAKCYVVLGKTLEAYDDASKAIELDPSNSAYCVSRGEILRKMQRTDDALKDLNKAIGMDDGYMDYYQHRAYLHKTMDVMDKAADDVDRALKCTKVSHLTNRSLKQVMSEVCCYKGSILDGKGDTKGALEWYSKAMREDEKNARPYLDRGDLYKRHHTWRESEADLAKAKELEEKYPERNDN